MEGNHPNSAIDDEPVWAWLIRRQWFDAMDEAWQAGADPNILDQQQRNWLHVAILEQVPTWVALEGLRRMGDAWWKPDEPGLTPFHYPIFDSRLAQTMIVRWWSEQRRWAELRHPFDPLVATLPQTLLWRSWKPLLRP